ncbi:MAG: pyruvate:ferredoxin (flavodoxin) oxidoreductase [Candidatus Marinimicrobia bacterium]|jgi:pyruvate-ferredoxin/flavodoxin oxidoreductase|nr:pyruvate:ferredoxin (flavodoxin) oxidoreductase [Candidatus Neomarinimicrobiota bacterium]MBT3576720.1 pyruvate:ferredoxin (flavodoxin) oxidoreductase [Candidatus Neomarinimicrobiota bacterium]MBT3679092.1 pyruvate:ferredoxin (flavodoxin) oxidoreductase [Candidatus Neomarinimicrobiota bacterium]MBT3951857.1 pyruvate:ferredoxin (flavodoxin) oxidoreductase [Candidatus Neomarinimicrobiota bacterium]MBT4253825.1 pyruvate:ferredoxin (flavodoxin) oxidoreductase [Candidatus Neomarinimicrobiota bact
MTRKMVTIDGNDAAAYIAHKTNEICAIYPITPSSNMGELADAFSAQGRKNIWGTVPTVEAMQSEGGAAGAVHGALQTGALTTTFTASQGLLLMIPNMYKIAGELTSTVFHVSARSLAAQALSIFGDHSDVMSTRATGWGMLAANSVQEVMDSALIAQSSTLQTRVPFIHFFDGFRTSHEVMKIEQLEDEDIRGMIDDEWVIAHRNRGMNPNRPVLRGTAQNPDVYFQGRETVNPYYEAAPEMVQKTMDRFAKITGRQYHLFDYVGPEDADRVIIIMGSGAETVEETINHMNTNGEKVGMLKVRLFRPFSIKHFITALPASVKKIAVLDRTKEPGGAGEPMYQDVVTAFAEAAIEDYFQFEKPPVIVGGRYGLSSKEFTPAMIKVIYDELSSDKPKNHFTIGINDDVSHTSLDYDPEYRTTKGEVFRGLFYGLGSDGTVGANKNSIKIIGEGTENYAQGHFVYDSKKSGSTTTSHLRFGKDKIQSTYLIDKANFIACHQYELLEQFDVLSKAEEGATFLLNSHLSKDEIWGALSRAYQKQIIDKKLNFYVINAVKVAQETGMGMRINTIMQTCFFAISGILPKEESIAKIKEAIKKTYSKKGEAIVEKNFHAVDQSVSNLFQVDVPATLNGSDALRLIVPEAAPDFVQKVTAEIIAGRGDDLPVSAMPNDGTWPTATTQWEKRNIALEVPVWEPDICIQCNKCAMVCPHAAIRPKIADEKAFEGSPETVKHVAAKGKEWEAGSQYILQVAVEDCTGCNLCVEICPARDKSNLSRKAINMADQRPLRDAERTNWDFFLDIPEVDRTNIKHATVKGSQLLQPLFEFSGACVGCGETPYVKLTSQLFGDRMIIANATGCSSIYGGNLPTTPWATNDAGRGPTWNNSLFEDNAEFGLGYRLTIDKHQVHAVEIMTLLKEDIGAELVASIANASQANEPEIFEQRMRVKQMTDIVEKLDTPLSKQLLSVADNLVKKSVWIMGGDGWAYDIGYGGLDHVLASGKDVNILVLDTEVYSNTGGQKSKATPLGAVAKFAAAGKPSGKKDLGMMAMSYKNVYVASVAMGSNDAQTVRAFMEAEAYEGPSLIIAYSQCIAHGIDMAKGMDQQKLAVDSAYWTLYRYNPMLAIEGKNPLTLDSKPPKKHVREYAMNETRFSILSRIDPELSTKYIEASDVAAKEKYDYYAKLAAISYDEA